MGARQAVCLKSLQGAFKQMLKSMFHPTVEQKKCFLTDCLLKETKAVVYTFIKFMECVGLLGWMDGYFVYRRSTLKGHIASNKFYVI